jgi:hypothetical protein
MSNQQKAAFQDSSNLQAQHESTCVIGPPTTTAVTNITYTIQARQAIDGKDWLVCLVNISEEEENASEGNGLITPTTTAHVSSPPSAREFPRTIDIALWSNLHEPPPSPKQEFPTASCGKEPCVRRYTNAPCVGSLQFDPRTRRSGTVRKERKGEPKVMPPTEI